MGLDAMMSVAGVHPLMLDNREWLLTTSWNLVRSLGAEPFLLNADDGRCAIYKDEDDGRLRVRINGRYYGEGYERGDLIILCAIAEWLEQNIPNAVVWYGSDCDGESEFPAHVRESLKRHLYSEEGREYFSGMGTHIAHPPACAICPGGKYRGKNFGSGGDGKFANYRCAGCGIGKETHDGGKTWRKA